MCRNITELRGLQPPATEEEISAAALQFVRKVTGIRKPNAEVAPAFEDAVGRVAAATGALLAGLPARRQPPAKQPPLRQPQVRARLGLSPLEG